MTQFKKENFALRAGEYLRQEIKRHHWTQYAFGRRFGVDVRTVGRWVNEGIDSVSTIESIARFFQVSVWDILSFDDDENVPDPLKSKQQKKTERKLKSFSLYFFVKGQYLSFYNSSFLV